MRWPQEKLRGRLHGLCTAVVVLLTATALFAADQTGGQIFRDQCARCHGKSGEGTEDNYPDPLAGDKTVAQLTELIHKSMPDDADSKCSAEDSAKVAAYIYNAFYSADARDRNNPVRLELSRLTVRQQQNALADLIGEFRRPFDPGAEHGLHAQYFADRRFNPGTRKIDRTDAEVHFQWTNSSPDPKQLDPNEFSAVWEGSVLAPDTGNYEFLVRTEHAVKLFVNNRSQPLIDAWVRSGNDTEHRGELHLVGGRAYPIRLEFSRAQQGVAKPNKPKHKVKDKNPKDTNDKGAKNKDAKDKQDSKDKHEEPEPPEPIVQTSISLEWKRPNHTFEVIPSRCLFPKVAPEVFVLETRFPPDDRSTGYERATSISKAWDEATTDAAIETAGYVTSHLKSLAGTTADSPANEPRLRIFCTRFAEIAFRRPLSEEQQKFYVRRQFESAPDLLTGIKRSILLVLKSPRFLYREVDGDTTDPYNVAARMSFGMWDSLPDDALLSAAKKGRLTSHDQIVAQLQRMLPNSRTRSKLRDFFLGWLKVSQPRDLSKDPKIYPEFTADVASDLRTSLELSIDDMLTTNSADFRQFLLGDAIYLNGRLAKVYGANLPADAPFQKVDFEPKHRAGVLSHPYLLASLAYTNGSSPIHRGVFVSRNVLGRVLRPPAQSVAPLPPEVHAELSTRERVALQTQPEACQGCHGMINPLGFTMEHFDAIGRYRELEHDRPVNATGSYLTQSGKLEHFQGMKDLAEFVATSDESQTAFVKQLFHHTVKQPIFAYGPHRLHDLQQYFTKNDFNIQKLLIEIVATSASPK